MSKPVCKRAFNQAKETVAKWEAAQGFEPSEPQWSIGKNMALMLPQLEQRVVPANNYSPARRTP